MNYYCRQVSLNGVMAGVFVASAASALIATAVLCIIRHDWIYLAGVTALMCGMTAATLTVRGFFIDARVREQKCFDTGREVGRAESSGVRDLHAIS